MKKLMTFAAALTALAATATDYTWDSTKSTGAWNNASNWGGSGYPSASSDKAIFNSAATVTISGGECVGTVSLGANVTIDGGSTSWTDSNAMEFGNVEASDYTLTLQNVGFQNIKTGGWNVTINPTVCIPAGYTASIWSSRGGTGNNHWYDLNKLTGGGTLYCRQTAGYSGVRLYGDNSGFTGKIVVMDDGSNRMKFAAKAAGSASAAFEVRGAIADNAELQVTGTYQFGELVFTGNGQMKASQQGIILQVGGKGTDFSMGNNNFQGNSPTVRKVGSGTMTVGTLQNLGTLQLDAGTTVWTDFDNLPSTAITFRGGTFKVGDAAAASDFSSLITNSGTSVYSIDTNGKNLDFATVLPATTGGITKSGTGTLDVDASNVTGTYTVNGGVLKLAALPATAPTLVLDGGAVTVVADATWTEGTKTLFNTTATSGITIDTTGLPSTVTIGEITYTGSAATVTVTKPELVWNGTETNWSDTGAWTANESSATFYDGAAVKFAPAASATDTVTVDGEVEVASMTIDTSASDSTVQFLGTTGVISGTSGALANAGSLVIGDGTAETLVAFDSALTNANGTIEVKENAVLQVNGTMKLVNVTGDGVLALGENQDYNLCTMAGANASDAAAANALAVKTVRMSGRTYLVQNTKSFGQNKQDPYSEGGPDWGNVYIANTLDIRGDGNFLSAWKSNTRFAGGLTGDGTLDIQTQQRGAMFTGDNSKFCGVVTNRMVNNVSNLSAGFYGPSSGSAHARFVLPSTLTQTSGGSLRSYIVQGVYEAASPIHFGALDVPNADTYVQFRVWANDNSESGGDKAYMIIGERVENGEGADSYLNGKFIKNGVAITKLGTGNLTLGNDFRFVTGTAADALSDQADGASSIIVSNGSLTVNCTNVLAAAVTVANGATLAGTGALGTVAFESGACLAFDGLPANPEIGAKVDGPTVTSWSGVKPSIANPATSKGKWVVKTKGVAGNRIQFYAEFVAKGFLIVIQ